MIWCISWAYCLDCGHQVGRICRRWS
ncbi:Putative protein of unknown function [Podospora comata]|uniref:Uncharacterized protein n=1 Tax=Podospora comata TaxID=48703 RepID=A0ABY6RVW6_PODCO|nr:Putative protein of unknown function [Podospora comata]